VISIAFTYEEFRCKSL